MSSACWLLISGVRKDSLLLNLIVLNRVIWTCAGKGVSFVTCSLRRY